MEYRYRVDSTSGKKLTVEKIKIAKRICQRLLTPLKIDK